MAQLKIGLIDYGAGNLRSVGKALELIGFQVKLTEDYHDLADIDGIVFSRPRCCRTRNGKT